ncbi:MAG TPA: cysteine--tRNA ligase [Kofleriaceae bacterium]|nr:cysteine--tRNA ligase [Kofleriaceae bacterium]
MPHTLKLKNTYTKEIEAFVPLRDGAVSVYTCGPTVYSFAHIGNFRTFLFADVLCRVLAQRGYTVRQVMNITDVGHMTMDHVADASGEDKLSKAARELGTDPYTVARHFEQAFIRDATALRLGIYQGAAARDAAVHPRATAHVAEMLVLIQRLIDRGFAYVDNAGQVYFSVEAFPEYGALSGKVIDELEAGARVAVREEKRDPRDFALWKVDDKHLMTWDPHSPAGWPDGDFTRLQALLAAESIPAIDARSRPGFPGWHIECSAMACARLGDRIDVHTGGEDNIFPHHECEIAQSWGALGASVPAPPGASDAGTTRKTFARYWLHSRHLLVDGKKMSKRDGTFLTAADLLDARAAGRFELAERLEQIGFADGRVRPTVLRYALISNQYTQPMNFTFDLLVQANASVDRLQSLFERLREVAGDGEASPELRAIVAQQLAGFDAALDDNLNMPNALAAMFELVTAVNQRTLGAGDATLALEALDHIDAILDVLDRRPRSGLVTRAEIEAAIAAGPGDDDLIAPLDAAAITRAAARRQAAMTARDFKKADAIRDALKRAGVVIEDLPQGVRWKLVES